MGLFDIFRKREPLPRPVKRVFDAVTRELEGKKIVDEAISYRNVGNYQKSLSLLMKALTEFDYKPAILLIGTTAVESGDVEGAIEWFSTVIEDQTKRRDFPLMELYANLGSIYSKHRKEYRIAIELYQKALRAPRPPIFGDDYYMIATSAIQRDMAVTFYNLGDLLGAREFAERCLQVNGDCAISKEIISQCEIREKLNNLNRHVIPDEVTGNQPDAISLLRCGRDSNYVGILLSIWQIAWDQKVPNAEKIIFAYHMDLAEGSQPEVLREIFSHAMLHLFVELKESHADLPEAISKAVRLIPERYPLPQLPRPLSEEIKRLMLRVFVNPV